MKFPFALSLALFSFCPLVAQVTSVKPPAAARAAAAETNSTDDRVATLVRNLVERALEAENLVGLSVAVGIGNRIILAEGFGLAELEHGIKAGADTLFRIGSVTKQFTAAGIVRLAEQGELSIDDPLTDLLPDYPMGDYEITLRQLLRHTSGIAEFTRAPSFWSDARPDWDDDTVLALFKDKPLDFEPGTSWSYSNSGYHLLGLVLAEVSGLSYAEFVRAELAQPLGLAIRAESNQSIIPGRAQGYVRVNGALRHDHALRGAPGGAGALLASAGDLVRWQIALVNGDVVSPAGYIAMTKRGVPSPPGPVGYGFGLMVGEERGRQFVRHAGGMEGFTAGLAYLPKLQISVAVISNLENFKASTFAGVIERAVASELAGEDR